MADRIPQFENEQPILQTEGVNSAARGYETFAQSLAALADKSVKKVEEIESDKSQTMYVNSIANIEQLKTSAEQSLLENPAQAEKIKNDSQYTLETIKQSAFVNDKDRKNLDYYISQADNDISLKAVRTEVRQRQYEVAFGHYSNWPDQLKAYQDALMSDPERAKKLHDSMVSSLHGLVSIGAITPEQAGSGIKDMQGVVEVAQDLHEAGYRTDLTARDYHTINSTPYNSNKNDPHAPINANTGWLTDYHNRDKTFQGVMADINNRVMPDPETFSSLNKNERKRAILAINGVKEADGLINSGEPFPVIENIYKNLTRKNAVLSYKEQATRNALGGYINDLKNGNFLNVMAQTPAGNSILQQFNERNAAIQNSSDNNYKKMQLMIQNKNKMVDAAISYGEGHHIPSEYIQPIPQGDISVLENSFNLGQDPEGALQIIGQYNKNNIGYLANSLKNPDQQMVVHALSLLGNDIKPQEMLDFIAANQTGRTFLNKEMQDETKDKTLMTRIYTNLSSTMQLIQQNNDPEKAQILQNSILKTTLQYSKYLAQKDNNIGAADKGFLFSDSNWKQYVDNASKIYLNAFQQRSGSNWTVNDKQLPMPLTNSELDLLANYVTKEGYKYLMKGRKSAEFESAIGRNPLKMILSNTNELLAVDGNGKTYHHEPLTSILISKALQLKKEEEKEQKKISNGSETLGSRLFNNQGLAND